MSSSWHQLDDQRENWLLLRVGIERDEESDIGWWELVVGNATQLIRSHASKVGVDVQNESEVLTSLFEKLERYRDQEPLLITPSRMTLKRLRARLVEVTTQQFHSLRGFRHLCLDEQLERQFGHSLSDRGFTADLDGPLPPETDYGDLTLSTSTTQLWDVWTSIYALLPLRGIRGERL